MSKRIFSDQTGKLPKRVKSGGRCLMIACVYDTNAIIEKVLKNRKEVELNRACTETCDALEKKFLAYFSSY